MQRVYLGLGSNIGDRAGLMCRALDLLARLTDTRIAAVSHAYETEPWGDVNQPSFLNMAAEIETALAPLELLNAVKAIEAEVGRTPTSRWGPREIDIDLILWDGRVIDQERLKLPHPEFRARAFVLVPLAEIASGLVDPVSRRTIEELAADPAASGKVNRCGPIWPAP